MAAGTLGSDVAEEAADLSDTKTCLATQLVGPPPERSAMNVTRSPVKKRSIKLKSVYLKIEFPTTSGFTFDIKKTFSHPKT